MKRFIKILLAIMTVAIVAVIGLRVLNNASLPMPGEPDISVIDESVEENHENDQIVTDAIEEEKPSVEHIDVVQDAVDLYEIYPIDCPVVDREKEQPLSPIPDARYTKDSDGIWRSAEQNDTDEAVIILTGDLMCQTKQQLAAKTDEGYDFRSSFDFVKPIFAQADLVVGNLEAVLCESMPYMSEMKAVEDKPHLNAPSTFLEAVRYAGFDMVVMSNNHNCDAGVRGIFDTIDHVDEYKLIHTGLFQNEEDERYTIIDVNGIKVAVLSYATYFNKKEVHFTDKGVGILLNRYTKNKAARDIKNAKEHGAEFVIVYIHWGTEYTNEPNEKQYVRAQELADAGADYIIGSHPHALQPYDVIESADGREVPVVYSMGNFLSHQAKDITKDTIILKLVLDKDDYGDVLIADEDYIPAYTFDEYKGRNYVVVPYIEPYKDDKALEGFEASYERITEVMSDQIEVQLAA